MNKTIYYNGASITLIGDVTSHIAKRRAPSGEMEFFSSLGIDSFGNSYLLLYRATPDWERHSYEYEHGDSYPEIGEWLSNEENACDWDSPITVTFLGR